MKMLVLGIGTVRVLVMRSIERSADGAAMMKRAEVRVRRWVSS